MTNETIITIKAFWYGFSTAFFSYFWIPQTLFEIIAILMIFDFISGIAKQKRLNPNKITSNRGTKWMLKKVLTMLSVLSIALVLKALEINDIYYIKAVVSIFIVSEAYSVLQNIYTYRTGIEIGEFDVISIAIKNFTKIFEKIISKLWWDLDEEKTQK